MTARRTGPASLAGRLSRTAARRIRRIRRPSSVEEWVGAAAVGLVAALLAVRALEALAAWLLRTWWAIPTLTAAAAATAWVRIGARRRRDRAAARRLARLRYDLDAIDAMSAAEFEQAIRDLMIRDGMRAQHVGGRGDFAADIIATHPPTRRRVVVQCKHTAVNARVGPSVIHEVNGTAGPAHNAHVAVVVTNGGFTRTARERADLFRIALVDREALDRWAARGESLPDMLALGSRLAGRRHRLPHRSAG